MCLIVFTQIVITKEATSYVVSERILKKTPEQKAFDSQAFGEILNALYRYVFPDGRVCRFIPNSSVPIDVFNKIYLIENRHILKISL